MIESADGNFYPVRFSVKTIDKSTLQVYTI